MSGKLATALAAFQAELPAIDKAETAEVKNDQGRLLYSYSYADLGAISLQVLPLLGKFGLAFTAKPTVRDGRNILAYSLLHESGEREDGEYPLPDRGTPQQMGSAITYGRRYCLCAVTGVAPEDGTDDDGRAASSAPAAPPEPPPNPLWEARADVQKVWTEKQPWDQEACGQTYAKWSEGELIADASVEQLRKFADSLRTQEDGA